MIGPQSAALDVPFRVDGTGRIMATYDLSRQIALRLESIIGTTPGERVMRPSYGAGAGLHVFDVNDELSASVLAGNIQDAVNAMEPAVLVEDVSVVNLEPAAGLLEISVEYRLRSTGEVERATVAISPTNMYGWPT